MVWRHSDSTRPQKFRVQKSAEKVLASIFLGSRQLPPHWLSSKGPNYQRGVLLISAGAIEGLLKEKRRGKFTKGAFFLQDNAPVHPALAIQKKLAYLGFQFLDHPAYSLYLATSDYHLFPGLKKSIWKVAIFRPTRSLLPRRPGWTDNLLIFFWVACIKLEQRAKTRIELRGEYVE